MVVSKTRCRHGSVQERQGIQLYITLSLHLVFMHNVVSQ